MSQLGYDYRPDGEFLVNLKCTSCGERYDVHAMSNAAAPVICPACKFVDEQMRKGN